ncbi:MAG: ABC transporter transmembrane domain-containing protein [Candidatus Nanopelagicaceae bacterium]
MKSEELRLLLSRSRSFVPLIGVAALVWSAIVLANAYLITEIIIRIIHDGSSVPSFIFALGSLWLIRALFQAGFDYYCSTAAIRIKGELRSETTSRIANFNSVSELSNVMIKGLNSLDIYIGRFVPQLIFATVIPVAVLVAIFRQDILAGLIALLTLPLIPAFGALIGRYSADAVNKKWRTLGTLSKYFEDSMRGFATLKIFGRTQSQGRRIEEMGDRYTNETMKVLRISFLSAFALELVATISVAVVAVSIGLRLVSGSIDFRSALLILLLAPEVYFPVRNAASLFHASQDGTEALRNLAAIDSEEILLPLPVSRKINLADLQSISWSDWSLPRSAVEAMVIPATKIERGEMLFLIGESGAGKTTFALNLLGVTFNSTIGIEQPGRFYELAPEMQREWQKIIGWIPQHPQLANGSVRDQFTLLDANISDREITAALLRAGLSLQDLPQGLDTRIGRGGESSHAASGGQIRRIAVARALVRNPIVIVADEPTADLDDMSAKVVMDLLRSAQRDGAIVICITHDLSLPARNDRNARTREIVRRPL